MSETIKLAANLREETGKKLVNLRKNGILPAVLYGHKIEPKNISLGYLEFSKAYKAAGENTLLSLSIGEGKTANVLIHDVQIDPMSNRFLHADFFEVRMDEEIETNVPITFSGEAPAVREQGGILVKSIEELPVKALPKDLPHTLDVDLSILATFDDHIKVSDIKVPKGVTIDADPGTVIASVMAPRTEAEIASLSEKVEMDVTKVEGVVKTEAPSEAGEEEKEKK